MAEPIITAAAAATATAPAVKAALTEFGKTIGSSTARASRSFVDRAVVALQIGFEEYLNTSYNKCRHFKTILNPSVPSEVIPHYVNITLSCGNSTIVDDDLIATLPKKQRVVVTGLAGSGKSMFMKYLTVRHFEYASGQIPLFVELRHLNSLTNRDLITFIRSSCTSKLSNISESQFELSLASGALVLVFDGFDELHHEIRDDIQRQILSIEKDFPKAIVIVSSRPDERFGSWSSYFVYRVNKLTKTQVTKLIQSLEYDSGVKRRFLKEVTSRLYESHQSFLSSPLLASIMLLTYEDFAEIPQKMHSFYGQAFDTLFQKHDAQKEQYQRKTHTGLSRDDFRKCFSAFCAMSYLDNRFSFSETDILSCSDSAIKYSMQISDSFSRSVTGKQFCDDLFESVCMIQWDGIEVSFVHRSFQEYFAAIFAAGLHGENVRKCLDNYARRFGDSVIPMTMDLSRELVEKEWVIPNINEFEQQFWPAKTLPSAWKVVSSLLPRISFYIDGNNIETSARGIDARTMGTLESMRALYPKHMGAEFIIFGPFDRLNRKLMQDSILRPEFRGLPRFDTFENFLLEDKSNEIDDRHRIEIEISEDDNWWLEAIGFDSYIKSLRRSFASIRKEINSREKNKRNILDDFL